MYFVKKGNHGQPGNFIKSICFYLILYTPLFTSVPKYTFGKPETRYIIYREDKRPINL